MERYFRTTIGFFKKKQSSKNLGKLSDRICNPATTWYDGQLVCEFLNISRQLVQIAGTVVLNYPLPIFNDHNIL
ncbi:MAG: hypothetical protein ABSD71_08215 [Bacteroidales bacterium]|jgi:hypothetical protein